MQIPTVRVVHPNDSSVFMTINTDQLTEEHELWPEQADAGVGIENPRLEARTPFDGFAFAAVRIVLKYLAQRASLSVDEWNALPEAERGAQMRAAEAELDALPDETAPRHVAKGPKGLWFVMIGERRVSKGFPTEAEAQAALDKPESP